MKVAVSYLSSNYKESKTIELIDNVKQYKHDALMLIAVITRDVTRKQTNTRMIVITDFFI